MPFKINIIETGSSDCPSFLKDRVSNDLFPKFWSIGNLNILVIWRDGKVVKIPADQIELREHQAGY